MFNKAKYNKKWYKNNPWSKHYSLAKSRCLRSKYYKNIEFNLTSKEVKELWIRDKANLLNNPSIDRIDNNIGYKYSNCRFIEKSENSRRGGKTSKKLHIVVGQYKNNKLIKKWLGIKPTAEHLGISECLMRKAIHNNRILLGFYWKEIGRVFTQAIVKEIKGE